MTTRNRCFSLVNLSLSFGLLVLLLMLPACGGDSGTNKDGDTDVAADVDLPGGGDYDINVADRDLEDETGDTEDETVESDEEEGDVEEKEVELPEGLCNAKDACPEGEYCYWKENYCKEACDPENPTCSKNGETCMLLTDDWYGGEGKGICVPMDYSGKKEAYACNNATPCQTHLLCLDSSCHKICDPDGIGVACGTGQSCQLNSELGVGVCGFCSTEDDNCPAGYECQGGVCVESPNCDEEEDCVEGKHCDLIEGTCGLICNPLASQCPSQLICSPLVDEAFATLGEGVCTVASDGGAFGASCDADHPCQRTLLCLDGVCLSPCDAEADPTGCPDGILCMEDDAFAYDICKYCDPEADPSNCPDGTTCLGGYCLERVSCDGGCPDGSTCYPPYDTCRPDCDPLSPDVEAGFVCGVIAEGDDAGKGVEVVAQPDAAAEGEACGPQTPCQPQLLCFGNICRPVCDTQAQETTCENGLTCGLHDDIPIGICRPCGESAACPAGSYCDDGVCLDGWVCETRQDCPETTDICLNGFCEEGCHDGNPCPTGGVCESDGRCSYNNCSCSGDECCNVGECGLCCENNCPPGYKCQYGAACAPAAHCCLPFDDCRDHDDDWCPAGMVCGENDGLCFESCPTSCPFGQYCDDTTDFRCYPYPPETCQLLTDPCDTPCLTCQWDFMNGAWCMIDTNTAGCTPSCLGQGVMWDLNGLFSCCEGLTKCTDRTTGRDVCCLADNCTYNGCQIDVDGDVDDEIICDCAEATGLFCANDDALQACEITMETLYVEWEIESECQLKIYNGDPAESGVWLADKQGCDSEPIVFLTPGSATYTECVLFWDEIDEQYRVNCTQAGTGREAGCSVEYRRETCYQADGDEEADSVEWEAELEDELEAELSEEETIESDLIESETELSEDEIDVSEEETDAM